MTPLWLQNFSILQNFFQRPGLGGSYTTVATNELTHRSSLGNVLLSDGVRWQKLAFFLFVMKW